MGGTDTPLTGPPHSVAPEGEAQDQKPKPEPPPFVEEEEFEEERKPVSHRELAHENPETVFGLQRKNWQASNPYSSSAWDHERRRSVSRPFTFRESQFPNAFIDNQPYTWTDSVVLNGARLAKAIHSEAAAAERPSCSLATVWAASCVALPPLAARTWAHIQQPADFSKFSEGDRNVSNALLKLRSQSIQSPAR